MPLHAFAMSMALIGFNRAGRIIVCPQILVAALSHSQLQARDEEKCRLEAQVLHDRADFTSQAKLLSQHFTQSHHRNTALQVSHEALQVWRCSGCLRSQVLRLCRPCPFPYILS